MAVFATAPALSRAIAECTQAAAGDPFSTDGAHATSAAWFVLHTYLADQRSRDAVYLGLMQRAWAQPLSIGIVERVIAIVRQSILTNLPSETILRALQQFCHQVPRAMVLSATARRSLQYLQSSLQGCMTAAGIAMHPLPSTSAAAGDHSAGVAGGGTALAKGNLAALPQTRCSKASEPDQLQTSMQGPVALLTGTGQTVVCPGEALANWGLASPAQQTDSVSACHDDFTTPSPPYTEWTLLLPETSCWCVVELPGSTQAGQGPGAALPVSGLLTCALDIMEHDIGPHLTEVLHSMQAEELQSGAHSVTQHIGAAAAAAHRASFPGTSRSLFHHLPYSQQDELLLTGSSNLTATPGMGAAFGGDANVRGSTSLAGAGPGMVSGEDVALAIEVVLGPSAAFAAGLATPRCGERSGGRQGGNEAAGYWESQFGVDGLGQACSSILIKLITDLYLRARPSTSYPLVLRMLHRALAHCKRPRGLHDNPDTDAATDGPPLEAQATGPLPAKSQAVAAQAWRSRACVFDLLYNLAAHAPLLYDADHISGNTDGTSASSEAGETNKGAKAHNSVEQFRGWLRALLFPLLSALGEFQECQEGVWAAALGCLLQLTVQDGAFIAAWVRHLPLPAIAGLLHACNMFSWSQELYCHLLHLYCHVSTISTASALGVTTSSTPSRPTTQKHSIGDRRQSVLKLARLLRSAPSSAAWVDLLAALVWHTAGSASEAQALTAYCMQLGPEAVAAVVRAAAAHPLTKAATRVPLAIAQVHPDVVEAFAEGHKLLVRLVSEVEAAAKDLVLQGVDGIVDDLNVLQASITPLLRDQAIHRLPKEQQRAAQAWQALRDLASSHEENDRQLATHWLHQLLSAAFHTCQADLSVLSPSNLKSAPPFSWRAHMADTLTHLVRVAPQGSTIMQQATLRAVADLCVGQGPASSTAEAHQQDRQDNVRTAMYAIHVVLQWLVQSTDSASVRACSQPAIDALADHVLESCSAPLQRCRSNSGSSNMGIGGQTARAQDQAHATAAAEPTKSSVGGGNRHQRHRTSSGSGTRAAFAAGEGSSAAGGRGAEAPYPAPEMPIGASPLPPAGSLLAGWWGFNTAAVQAVPPELLVQLLQHCSPPEPHPASPDEARQPLGSAPMAAALPRLSYIPANVSCGASLEGVSSASAWPPLLSARQLAPAGLLHAVPLPPETQQGALSAGPSVLSTSAAVPGAGGASEPPMGLGFVAWCGGPASERRVALLLALLVRCGTDGDTFAGHNLEQVLQEQLEQGSPRERYLAGAYLLQHWSQNHPRKYWASLQRLLGQASSTDDERLLHNPYLKMRAILSCLEGQGEA